MVGLPWTWHFQRLLQLRSRPGLLQAPSEAYFTKNVTSFRRKFCNEIEVACKCATFYNVVIAAWGKQEQLF